VDVTRDVDVVEEILRIYGYNNIEIPTQIRASLNNSVRPEKDTVQNVIADLLSANGFNEMLANSLTKLAYSDNPDACRKDSEPIKQRPGCHAPNPAILGFRGHRLQSKPPQRRP
jgi:phenylalanyl-tRNA synthetase beta chain